ncbi:YitT family protein [Virgibacillus sp. YIM 98842]|uniref:YitT family protein n=1 Tax=Virgibacillus sp. YIM 98842 TaxID=2663533 RepID=UPI0013DC0C94|nr:YitT family protein [Virgibacillus sp. YIM 98842]
MNAFLSKFGLVILGGVIQGAGMGLFLFPHSIPSGGAGGLTVLFNYWFGISMGLALWIINFSFLLLGMKILGRRFAVWTVVAITMTSVSVQLFEQISMVNRSLVYDLTAGSILLGTGIGILMRQGVSNGGIGVVALIISVRRKILPGKPLFIVNMIIFLFTALIIDWKLIFLALISQWISTKLVDLTATMSLQETYTLDWRKKT